MKKRMVKHVDAVEPVVADRSSLVHAITRFWVSLAIIVCIAYVALLAISRTEGFRDLMRQQLERRLNLPLKLEGLGITPGLNIRITGLVDAAATNRLPALEVGEASLSPKFVALLRGDAWPVRRLMLRNCTFRFTPMPDGTWSPFPELAANLAPWVNLDQSANVHPAEWLRLNHSRLDLQNIRLVWQNADGGEVPVAIAEGVHLKTSAVQPFDQSVLWSIMTLTYVQTKGQEWLRDLELEWIRMPDQDVVLRIRGADTTNVPAPLR